jgi:Domain of unknown function (DUF6429)
MEYDKEKVDEVVLALLYLTSFTQHGITRTWKGQDWDVLDRLHEKGLISDPKSKAKSVMLSDDGAKESARLFQKYFASSDKTS